MTAEQVSNLIKTHYQKNIFQTIKAYKRYYCGIWLLKFYKLISKKDKIEIWTQKRLERFKKIRQIKYLNSIYPQIQNWLNSQEFKKKYIDTKHPYPPYLNPDTIDYESIEASLAWDLNLPLPNHYDFLYVSSGAAASAASLRFLQDCKVNVNDGITCKGLYEVNYRTFLAHKDEKNCFFAYNYYTAMLEEAPRLCNTLRKKPLLFIARDPIERIQHTINHLNDKLTFYHLDVAQQTINLTFDYNALFQPTIFFGDELVPLFKTLENEWLMRRILIFDSSLKALKDKISFVHCVEFNDLKADKAFDTFCELASIFGFEKPKNKEIFSQRINRNRGALTTLPTIIYAHKDDLPNLFEEGKDIKSDLSSIHKKGGFNLIITLPQYVKEEQKDFVNISEAICPNCIIDDCKILVLVNPNDLLELKKNTSLYNASVKYITTYVNALKNNAATIQKLLISETQILEYFKQNHTIRRKIKTLLDNELNYIKKHHSDFIEKWKYYLEFEKICNELDGEAK